MLLHKDSSYETYYAFFSHRLELIIPEELVLVFDSDDEKAMPKATRDTFPSATRLLRTKNVKDSIKYNMQNWSRMQDITRIMTKYGDSKRKKKMITRQGTKKENNNDGKFSVSNVPDSEQSVSSQEIQKDAIAKDTNPSQKLQLVRLIVENDKVTSVQQKTFMVKGNQGSVHAVILLPKETCQWPPTAQCYHMSAKISIGDDSENKPRIVNLRMLSKRNSKRNDKKSGRKKTRKILNFLEDTKEMNIISQSV
ncbi:unnamed protein product [Mytilus edulis]|uniref:Uncharacterized protein n=1 Tax=Mytilus edulis TaxID=6550 RepID=A0A8S3TTF0_MYTED|nr:unnamed protein product [Mytilus edulis]